MKKIKVCLIVLLGTLVVSCKDKPLISNIADPRQFASSFCDCMKENNGEKDYLYALTVCNGQLVKQSKFYRLYRIDFQYLSLEKKINRKTADSVFKFMRVVDSLTRKNCCKAVGNCPVAAE